MNKTAGVLGSGAVGQRLAAGLQELGYEVALGNRTGHSVENWDGAVGNYDDVSAKSDMLVLCLKGDAAETVITSIKNNLDGKTVIDTTNPISGPPEDSVLPYFTDQNESLMERLQKLAPKAHFVKAFNSVGNGQMVHPSFVDGKPTMFMCGDSSEAKAEATEILEKFGWEVADMGGVKSARAIESLCILWCTFGFINNEWSHAFKLLRS